MDTQVVVILGERRSGKSTVGQLLREMAGVGSEADLEFSDFMIQGTNFALDRRARSRRRFPINLFAGALWVLGREIAFPGAGWFISRESAQHEHRALLRWLEESAENDLRIDRGNKIHHLAPLIWQGYFLRHPELAGADSWGRLMAETIRPLLGQLPLVTVAGARDPGDIQPIKDAIPDAVTIKVWREAVRGDRDPTNRHHHLVVPDADIDNDGTVPDLMDGVSQFYSDIISGRFENTADSPWYNRPPVRSQGLEGVQLRG